MSERLTSSLQESVLTLLATNDTQGRIAAGLLQPAHFDDGYRDIATRVLDFHKKNGKAPGKAHLDDLLDDVLSNPKHKKRTQYLHVLEGVYAQAEGLNADYVLSRVSGFARLQSLKAAWFDAADILKAGGEGSAEEVEAIWLKALRAREEGMDAGVFLSDRSRALDFLDRTSNFYRTGIGAFDKVGFGPTPGEILLLIAPKGKGKSWWAIHTARQCLIQGARVVHITLEMSISQVIQRYYQNFFGMPKRGGKYEVTTFEFEKGITPPRLIGLNKESFRPRMSLSDAGVRRFLNSRIKEWGTQFDRLVVQEFPTGSLTIAKLEAYLDFLEVHRKFVPNVLVIDYPDLMKLKGEDIRVETGRTYVELRGLLGKRKLAGIFPTQGNRESWDASTVKASMISEDASKVYTSGMVAVYSQTREEKERRLARLFVAHNRGDADGFEVLLSQNYATGQFVLDSVRMRPTKQYWDLIGPRKRKREDDEDVD